MIRFIFDHWALIVSILWGVSELLSFIPSIKANGIFQAIYNFLYKETKK